VTDLELPITEPQLLERLAMDDRQFGEYVRGLAGSLPAREYEDRVLAHALGYPWKRPGRSYRLSDAGVEPLEEMSPAERDEAIADHSAGDEGRRPLLAIGSNGAPEILRRKFAHFPEAGDRALLALTGRLHEFDVGYAAQPAIYGSLPATLFPSPGTAVSATVLWVTPAQFTQIAWSELSYRLGRLETRFEVDEGGAVFDEVLVFVSRFGAFQVEGEPVALAAVPADGRTARALTQEEVLDAAAALAIGPGAKAEELVRAIYEDFVGFVPRLVETVNRESAPFASERWTPFGSGA
jgi:hypothetical protein